MTDKTTIGLDRLSVWLPGSGTVLSSVSADLHGVCLLSGRNGSGASTLLRAVAGMLPPGARVRGEIRLGGSPITGLTATELAGVVDASHLTTPLEGDLRALLHGVDPALVTAFDLPTTGESAALPQHQRAALRLIRACARPRARVLLLDQPLAGLAPEHRPTAAGLIRSLSDDGTTVLWAEHLLEHALSGADQVVELAAATVLWSGPAQEWRPRTVPAPPAAALARALGLPRSTWCHPDPELIREALGDAPARHGRRHRATGDLLATATPDVSRLDRPLELRARECVGVVAAGTTQPARAREVEVARRLVAIAKGARTLPDPLTVPRALTVGQVATRWERIHRLPSGAVLDALGPLARPDLRRAVHQHSTGEQQALAWALSSTRPGPRLYLDPTEGIDPFGRRHIAHCLHDEPLASSILVTADLELLVRACHRLLVVDDDSVVADGAPLAVLDRLPHLPQLTTLGIRAVHVEDLVPAATLRAVRR